MKRICMLFALLVCAMLTFTALAVEAVPGDTVTLPVSIYSQNKVTGATLTLNYNSSALELVESSTDYGIAGGATFTLFTFKGTIPDGQIGTVTFKVKDTAKSGKYVVSVTVNAASDFDENLISASASAGFVTVVADCAHDKTEDKVTKEADCENAGTKQIVCTDCGEVISTETIDALGHDMGEWKESKAPTCEAKGVETATCTRCGKTETRDVDALEHKFGEWKETKAPACEVKGEETSTCALCGKTETRDVDALDHKFGEWKETKAPACEVKGEETSTCALCGKTETRDVDALEHKFGEWKETKAPACEVKGEENSTCELCGKTETRDVDALGHDVGEWVETKAPTCTEKGEETATCSRCGEFDTREVAVLGHSFGKWTIEKEATCEEKGLEYRVCGQCGEREERAIKALGHNAVWKVIYPATREEEGLKQQICKRCEAVLAEQVLPILKTTYKTACTAGIRISELAPLMDQYDAWKMVTPVDLSVEGTTRYPLVAGNVYEIGYVDVTVADGAVSAELVVEAKVNMYSAALVLLNDASEFKRFTANDYEHYEFPASINLSDLPSDQMLMMVTCQLTIDMAKPEPKYYNFKSAEHEALIEQLNEIIK